MGLVEVRPFRGQSPPPVQRPLAGWDESVGGA
jgi:hypothetical protein